jgi:hypothetical protein
MSIPPFQKSYGAHPGFLQNLFQEIDPQTLLPTVDLGVGKQVGRMKSESYQGFPRGRGPLVRRTEFNHTPRHFLHSGTFILKNNHPNRGPFMTAHYDDPNHPMKAIMGDSAYKSLDYVNPDGTRISSGQAMQQVREVDQLMEDRHREEIEEQEARALLAEKGVGDVSIPVARKLQGIQEQFLESKELSEQKELVDEANKILSENPALIQAIDLQDAFVDKLKPFVKNTVDWGKSFVQRAPAAERHRKTSFKFPLVGDSAELPEVEQKAFDELFEPLRVGLENHETLLKELIEIRGNHVGVHKADNPEQAYEFNLFVLQSFMGRLREEDLHEDKILTRLSTEVIEESKDPRIARYMNVRRELAAETKKNRDITLAEFKALEKVMMGVNVSELNKEELKDLDDRLKTMMKAARDNLKDTIKWYEKEKSAANVLKNDYLGDVENRNETGLSEFVKQAMGSTETVKIELAKEPPVNVNLPALGVGAEHGNVEEKEQTRKLHDKIHEALNHINMFYKEMQKINVGELEEKEELLENVADQIITMNNWLELLNAYETMVQQFGETFRDQYRVVSIDEELGKKVVLAAQVMNEFIDKLGNIRKNIRNHIEYLMGHLANYELDEDDAKEWHLLGKEIKSVKYDKLIEAWADATIEDQTVFLDTYGYSKTVANTLTTNYSNLRRMVSERNPGIDDASIDFITVKVLKELEISNPEELLLRGPHHPDMLTVSKIVYEERLRGRVFDMLKHIHERTEKKVNLDILLQEPDTTHLEKSGDDKVPTALNTVKCTLTKQGKIKYG